jgi:hypothetical protein
LTAADYRGWREPVFKLVEVIRNRGQPQYRRWQDWDDAVETLDRSLSIGSWAKPLAPGFADIELGLRLVPRPASQVDPRRTRARFFEGGSLEAKSGSARLDVGIDIDRSVFDLPGAQFRLHAAAAVLAGLNGLGEAMGLGPPPLRSSPRRPPAIVAMDAATQAQAGQWFVEQVDASPNGSAVVVAQDVSNGRLVAAHERFAVGLGDAVSLTVPPGLAFKAWRVRLPETETPR